MLRTLPVLTGVVFVTALTAGISQAANGISLHVAFANRAEAAAAADGTPDAVVTGDINSDLGSGGEDASTTHSAEADDRLKRADSHFNAGRQLYFQGDLTGARREFDAAVDVLLGAS